MPTRNASPKQFKGQQKEYLAERYLQRQGLKLLQRNFRCKLGEIDLIMGDGETRVFVEVRYRKRSDFGSAMESVNFRKQQKLIRAAQFFLQRQADADTRPSRFDVVAISGDDNTIEWVANAFGA